MFLDRESKMPSSPAVPTNGSSPSSMPNEEAKTTHFRDNMFIEEEEDLQDKEPLTTATDATVPTLPASTPEGDPEKEEKEADSSQKTNQLNDLLERFFSIFNGYFLLRVWERHMWVIITILGCVIFNITRQYYVSGLIQVKANLEKKEADLVRRQKFSSSSLTQALTEREVLKHLKEQGNSLAPSDSSAFIIYTPIPEELQEYK